MREPLTPKQHNLVDFVRRYGEQHGYAPTYEEIRQELGYRSLATVHEHVRALVGKGYLRQERGRSRSLRMMGEEEWVVGGHAAEEPLVDETVTVEDVRCARALLELVEASAVEPGLRDEAIRVARELLGPVEVSGTGPLSLIGAGRERLRRRRAQA